MRSLSFLLILVLTLALVLTVSVRARVHAEHHAKKTPVTAADKSAAWLHTHTRTYHTTATSLFAQDDRDDNGEEEEEDPDNEEEMEERMNEMLSGERSALCRQYDCPDFNATSYPTYTLRTYPSATFACTNIRSFRYGEGEQKKAFMRLYEYFGGESDQGTKINMTVPVVRYVSPGNGTHPNVTVCFFVPNALSSNPPTPKNNDIRLYNTSFTVAVHPFFGYGTHENVGRNLIRHQIALHLAKQNYCPNRYVHAAYTEPWIPFFRYNEIWTFLLSKQEDTEFLSEAKRIHTRGQQPPQTLRHGRRPFHTRMVHGADLM